MASACCEVSASNMNPCGPTMWSNTVQSFTETVGFGRPSVDMMYHTDAVQPATYANGHVSGSFVAPTPKPGPGSDGACFVYGMYPVPVPSEEWERMVGEVGGENAEGKKEEGVLLNDYMYHYHHIPSYVPYSHVYTASAPQHVFPPDAAAAAPPASPLILLTPATSSPSSTKSIPNSLSLKNEVEMHEDSVTKSHEGMNGHFSPIVGAAPQPPLTAVPQPVPAHGTYTYSLPDEKTGMIGGDNYLYALAEAHNMAPDPYTYMCQEPTTFPTTSSNMPDILVPPTSPPSISSTPPSAIPLSSCTRSRGLKKNMCKSEDFQFYNHYQHLDLPKDMFGKPQLLTSLKTEGKLCVEELWGKHMGFLFKHLPDQWVLSPLEPNRKLSSKWFSFRDVAKVRFFCKNCNDGWTSMYGVVVFHYRWNKKLQQGQIMYKMVGQKCNGNCASDWFELPLWYPEEAQKVITNLYYKIASQYYNLVTPQFIRTRRYGRPAAHHNRSLCEGCMSGLCKMDPVSSKISISE